MTGAMVSRGKKSTRYLSRSGPIMRRMDTPGEASAALQADWNELHDTTPPNWEMGVPSQRHGGSCAMYAFDQTEKPKVGRRSREWTAVGETEEQCIREMARCLREIGAGRVPT